MGETWALPVFARSALSIHAVPRVGWSPGHRVRFEATGDTALPIVTSTGLPRQGGVEIVFNLDFDF